MEEKNIYGFMALSIVALLSVNVVSAFPMMGFDNFQNGQNVSNQDFQMFQDFRQNLTTTLENEDYEAWKSLMESQLTEENFQKMVDAYNQKQDVHDLRMEMKDAWQNENYTQLQEARDQLANTIPGQNNNPGKEKGFWKRFRFWN